MHNSDNLAPSLRETIAGVDTNLTSEGIAFGEEALDKFLADERDRRRVRVVGFCKSAPGNYPGLNCLEVVRTYDVVAGARAIGSWEIFLAFQEEIYKPSPGGRQIGSDRCGNGPGRGFEMRGERAVELDLLDRLLIARLGQTDLRGEQVLRLKPEASMQSLEESLDEKTGAGQQDDGHGHFSGHE